MTSTRQMRRLTAWIASFAILLATLAPAISHAMAAMHGTSADWSEICTASGAKYVKVADVAPSKPATHQVSHFEHCPFCFSHAGALGLPPDNDLHLPSVAGTQILPPLFYRAPRPLFSWATAQPRAPPAFS
ncbi:MAG TPA: DUF2946 domain-containing protein [Oxalicibacterium sp.]|jgi:hypothetical protein|nr:DUF2946 domain-containing protein [Oxalicibacterium sp.]